MFGRFGRKHILGMEEALKDAVVYNCAAGGFDTRDGLKRAAFTAKLKADYVCLSFGANDSNPFKGRPVPIAEFVDNYREIVGAFSGSRVIIFPCPPVRDFNDLKEAENFNAELVAYNAAIKILAEKTGVIWIDSQKIYGKSLAKGENYHIEDGLHLNDLGYRILIREFKKSIR